MNDSIRRRGPDEAGHWLGDGVGLAMRRLSILDLAGSQQPISNEDETVTVVYNGEIYNYRELREQLIAKGHRLRTQGDTEVLVHLYEEYGAEMLGHLRGMFAFAIWDHRDQSLLVARDRLGIKPLFYAQHDGQLFFASEIKALLASQRLPRDLDFQAVDQFLTFTYIPAPHTIFRSISKLRPGHFLLFRDGQLREERYWDADFSRQDHKASAEEWRERFEAKLFDAVQSHLVSDVPLGAFLSGGIDSSLVVAMMSESTHQPVESFTMGFAGDDLALRDERPYARMLGERYDIHYNDFTVEPDFRSIMEEIVESFDEPFADDSVIPTYYISQLTRQKVKVALSGLGGDELFGGYHRYRGFLMSSYYDMLPGFLRKGVVDPIVQALPEPRGGDDRIDHLKRFSRFATLPAAERYLGYVSSLDIPARRRLYSDEFLSEIDFDQTSGIITEPFERCGSDDLLDKVFYTDLNSYLPDDILALSDRLSMWHSLELRVPLIDHELTELAATMPSKYKVRLGSTKWLLRGIAEKWLPREIVHHRKQGFESPMAAWLRGELREFATEILTGPSMTELGWFQPAEIQRLLDDHLDGRQKNNKILFSLLMLAGWVQKYAR
jgi:asparagine synthase (glutamine-hydrolysing)